MKSWVEELGQQLGESERGSATRYEPPLQAPPFRRCAAETRASSKRGAAKSHAARRAQKALAALGGGGS